MTDLSERAQRALNEMFSIVDTVDVDQIKTDGFTIRSGNRLLKMTVALEEELSIEDEIKEEYRLKLRDRMQEIKNRLNARISEMVEMTSRIKAEAASLHNRPQVLKFVSHIWIHPPRLDSSWPLAGNGYRQEIANVMQLWSK